MLVTLTHASANSLPGNVLYKVKVDIIEPIILSTKNTGEARVEYALSLLSKRIKELEELDTRGAKSQKQVLQNSLVVQKTIQILQNSGIINDEKFLSEFTEKIEAYNMMTGLQLRIQTHLDNIIKPEVKNKIPTPEIKRDISNSLTGKKDIQIIIDEKNIESVPDTIKKIIKSESGNILKDQIKKNIGL